MKKSIYICSTYYHVLIALVRSAKELKQWDILITDYINNRKSLANNLKHYDTFRRVFLITNQIKEYIPNGMWDAVFSGHKKNAEKLERELPIDLKEYDNIYIFHDDTWISHYLKSKKIKYFLLEDSYNSFITINGSPFSYMLPQKGIKSWLKKKIGLQHYFFQESVCVKGIEVNSKEGIKIPIDAKVIENPRSQLFAQLNETEKDKIFRIFVGDLEISKRDDKVLLLTQPLLEDGLVQNPDEQRGIYEYIIKNYVREHEMIYIKPHPRDNIIYKIRNVTILDRYFPVEVLNFRGDIHFNKVITVFSTAINTLNFVDTKVYLGFNELEKIKREVKKNG